MEYKELIPFLLPIASAITIVILKIFKAKEKSIFVFSLVFSVSLFGTSFFIRSPKTFFNSQLVVDRFSFVFFVVASIILTVTLFSFKNYRKNVLSVNFGEAEALLFFAISGLSFFVSSENLLVVFLGLEIFSFSSYILASIGKYKKSVEAGFKYLFLGIVASSFSIVGIALIYSETSSLYFLSIKNIPLTLTLSGGIILFFINIFFKFSLTPFHVWTPDVYEGSPAPVTLFFSVAPKLAIPIFVIRFLDNILKLNEEITTIFWIVAVLTILWANIQALSQKNLKRLMSYSSIAHSGYISMGFLLWRSGASKSRGDIILFYTLIYVILNLIVFYSLSCITRKDEEIVFEDIEGLYEKSPVFSIFLSIALISLAGFPPTLGFYAKFYLFMAVIREGFVWLTIFAVAGTVISAYYYLIMVKKMFFDKAVDGRKFNFGIDTNLIIVILGIVAVVVSLYPGIVFKFIGG